MFRTTSIRPGTFSQTLLHLSSEIPNSCVSVSFGTRFASCLIYLSKGQIVAAEFGCLHGISVFDLIICQENQIKEIVCSPVSVRPSMQNVEPPLPPQTIVDIASNAVSECAARPFIYGSLPVHADAPEFLEDRSKSIFDMLAAFDWYHEFFIGQPQADIVTAPIKQCALIRNALSRGTLSYRVPLIPLKECRSILEVISPLSEDEAQQLKGCISSLLPNSRASHISLERFYALASAFEAVGYRHGEEQGVAVCKEIYRIIQRFGPGGGGAASAGARVPSGRGPEPNAQAADPEICAPDGDGS